MSPTGVPARVPAAIPAALSSLSNKSLAATGNPCSKLDLNPSNTSGIASIKPFAFIILLPMSSAPGKAGPPVSAVFIDALPTVC